MSTHKHIDRICVVITVLALLITVLFMNGETLGIKASASAMGYETTLFDTSRVHTIDIVIDDWDAFLATATSEEYSLCSVVIDNEAVKNVAIRGKGNTSLSTVAELGSQRYSFKLEFDHYETGRTYKGLDKLCLNNLIQDNTYMKDYLSYRMMAEFGADAPLCSYVWVTVNGEAWGLYLAVEAVEDSFLQRVYNGSGDLYKPDSLSMGGGGPGNGRDFNIEDFLDENADSLGIPWQRDTEEESGEQPQPSQTPDSGGDEASSAGGSDEASSAGGNEASSAGGGDEASSAGSDMPQMSGQNGDEASSAGGDMPQAPDQGGGFPQAPGEGGDSFPGMSGEGGGFGGGFTPPSGDGESDERPEMPDGMDFGGFGGGMPGGFGMGSGDVKLQYSDDDADSYSNIFGNAKTDVTSADQARLIRSLKALGEGENLEDVLEVDELLRYFVVHNYLVNNDSYTGAMVHNYYLHEDDGKLSMIPWDYNLAFGTFQAGDAAGAVNDPIDSPLSVSGDGSRPMADWIFRNEDYTALYHQYFAEFLDTVDIGAMIDEAYTLIAPYVEKDPTAFCTYEEFEAGTETLRSFCEKRTESIRGQLAGTIPSTDAGQQADSSALVDSSGLTLSTMGSMGGGGGGMPGFGGGPSGGDEASSAGGGPSGGDEASSAGGMPSGGDEASSVGGMPSGGDEASSANGETESAAEEAPTAAPSASPEEAAETERPSPPEGTGGFDRGERPELPGMAQSGRASIPWPTLLLSAAVLLVGLLTAILYKRRK